MVDLEGQKVVEAREMARIEKESIKKGASGERYMLKAGEEVASRVISFIEERGLGKKVTLLVGKGNNGGDAFVAGAFLIEQGFDVQACPLAQTRECSSLCKKYEQVFLEKGGIVTREEEAFLEGTIIDGLLGTGFQGKLEGALLDMVKKANRSKLPIVSIDIPSGVNGNTGKVDPVAIRATETIYLGMAKLGFFIGEGYNYVGNLFRADFGMEQKDVETAKEKGFLFNEAAMESLLPPIERVRHKYQAGYVIAIAGFPGMPGAALLSSLASLRSGAGIVRLFHPKGMEGELSVSPFELIRTPYDWGDTTSIVKEAKRAKACLIGPGIGREKQMQTFIQELVSQLTLPMVIDADGLYAIKQFPKGAILTPHYKEMVDLLGEEEPSHDACQVFVDKWEVTVVLKGAPTWVFHPKVSPLIIPKGDPGMATAGAGDVLTGMIAAFLAQGLRGQKAGALGVYLHGMCGEIVAAKQTSYDLIATDLIEALPDAFQTLLQGLS